MNGKARATSSGENREVAASPLINSKNHGPGRELDALVAERVFGANRLQGGPYFLYPDVADGFAAGSHTLRSYSTRIDAAWQIIERIHLRTRDADQMWFFSKRSLFYRELERLCSVDDGRFQVAWPDALGVFRDQIPLFICVAALRAMDAPSAVDRSRFSPKTNPDDA